MAAGLNPLRRSGPNRKQALEDAMTQAGFPDLGYFQVSGLNYGMLSESRVHIAIGQSLLEPLI
jgi:hypothetical protein